MGVPGGLWIIVVITIKGVGAVHDIFECGSLSEFEPSSPVGGLDEERMEA